MPMCGAKQGRNAKPVAQVLRKHLPPGWRDHSHCMARPGANSLLHSPTDSHLGNPSPQGAFGHI